MPEYIEREALIQAGRKIALEDITPNWNMPLVKPALIEQGQTLLKLIKEQSAADVVKVVRCKDCKHAKLDLMEKGLVVCRRPALKNGQLLPFNWETKYADFCSYGELKEREG